MTRKLLDDDSVKVEVFRFNNEGLSTRKISERLGISKSSINDFLLKKSYKEWWDENEKPLASGSIYDHHQNIAKAKGRKFLITSAQNNTFVHKEFLKSLETAAEHLDAQIIVGTFSYNKTGFQNLENGDGEWFDPLIQDYIMDEPVQLTDGLLWCGELNILPTAVNPLSGLQSYTRSQSGIVPHAKVQLESLPTHKTESCRMLYTTGAVTLRNYIEKKTGQKASFHHVFGALLVEVDDDGDWFVRQLVSDSDTGYFQDLDTLYTPNHPVKNVPVEAINWGDIHIEKMDYGVFESSMNPHNEDSMLSVLRPKYQMIHDVFDMQARNHHNLNDPYFRFKMYHKGIESVESDVMAAQLFLESIQVDDCQTVVVESNHDLALKRWLKESDYKNDPVNVIFFLECQLAMYKSIERDEEDFSPLEFKIKEDCSELQDILFLKTDESFMICNQDGNGIQCGSHGDKGSNGSRGGIGIYQKLGSRYNIGHSHSAAIKDGVYVAGVSANLDMGYNEGASSWSHSHVVTYSNGKRTVITLKDSKWRAS